MVLPFPETKYIYHITYSKCSDSQNVLNVNFLNSADDKLHAKYIFYTGVKHEHLKKLKTCLKHSSTNTQILLQIVM